MRAWGGGARGWQSGKAGASHAAAHNRQRHSHTPNPAGFADNAAVALEVQLQQFVSPMAALAAFVHDDPDYSSLSQRFPRIAQELLAAVSLRKFKI